MAKRSALIAIKNTILKKEFQIANPQVDKYTRISNELVDKFCHYRLSGREWQVLWVVLRKTWGYHKKMDRISLGQFSELTQIPRRKIFMLLKLLENRGIIVKGVPKKGDSKFITYGIIKDYDEWKVSPKRVTKVSPKRVTKVSPKRVHTKDNKDNKDNTIVKGVPKKGDSDVSIARDYFYLKYEEKTGDKYVANFGKEGMLLKSILLALSIETIKKRIDLFFDSSDKFITSEGGYTIGVFYSQVNKLTTKKKADFFDQYRKDR